MQYILPIFIIFILLPIAIAWISMAPWVPTKKKDIQRLIKILELKPGEKFLEIWCWDARVSRTVASAFPQSQITGLELAYPMWIIAKIIWYFRGTKNCSINFGDAFKQDFSHYDVVYVYGMPDKIWKKIIPKFMSEAKSWVKLYSYVFSIPEKYNKWVRTYGEEGEAKIHVLEKI